MILVDSLFEYNNIIFIWWIQFNDYGDINIEHSYQINMDENNNSNSAKWRKHISAHSVILFGRCRRLHS